MIGPGFLEHSLEKDTLIPFVLSRTRGCDQWEVSPQGRGYSLVPGHLGTKRLPSIPKADPVGHGLALCVCHHLACGWHSARLGMDESVNPALDGVPRKAR